MISETESKRYYEEAFDSVIKRIQEGDDAALRGFVGSLDVYSQGPASPSIETWVRKITSRALALPEGFDAVVVPEVEGDPSALMRQMVELGETFISCLEGLPKPGRPTPRITKRQQKPWRRPTNISWSTVAVLRLRIRISKRLALSRPFFRSLKPAPNTM